ncbi:MAG: four helix bundle protein [Bacteroidaceae bacterium]|nr:four helix bundle protein [Bacteroidaceae bacterium]
MEKQSVIEKLSIKFALRIIKLHRYLNQDKCEFVISKQIYRSGTSIGANIAESKAAQSDADFINKMSIALKEAYETRYWLTLLHESETIDDAEFDSIDNDAKVIVGTLTNIIKKRKGLA